MFVALYAFPKYNGVLGPQVFGTVLVVLAASTIVSTIDLGLTQMIVRRAALFGHSSYVGDPVTARAAKLLVPASLVPMAILIAVGYVSGLVDDGGHLAVWVLAIAGGLIPVSFKSAQSRYEGSLNFLVPRSFLFGSSLLRVLASFFLSSFPDTVQVSVAILAESSVLWLPALGASLTAFATRRRAKDVSTRARASNETWPVMMRYGLGMGLSTFVGAITLNVDVVAVGWVMASSAVVVFAAGSRLVQVYRQIIGWALGPIASKLHAVHGQGGNEALYGVWYRCHPRAVYISSGIAGLVGVAGVVLIPYLLRGYPVDEIQQARLVVLTMVAGVVVSGAHQVSIQVLNAARLPLMAIPPQLTWSGLRVLGVVIGAEIAGVVGAGFGILVATLIAEFMYMATFAHGLSIPVRDVFLRSTGPAILASVVILTPICLAVLLGPALLWLGVLTAASILMGYQLVPLRKTLRSNLDS